MRFTLLFTILLIIIRATSISLPGTYTTITFFFSHHNIIIHVTRSIVKNRNRHYYIKSDGRGMHGMTTIYNKHLTFDTLS